MTQPEALEKRMNFQIKAVETNPEQVPLTFSIPVRQILESVWAKRWTVAKLGGSVALLLLAWKLFAAPSYNATATVQVGLLDRDLIEEDSAITAEPNVSRLRMPVMADLSNLESQETRLLASEGLTRAVVQRLGLDQAQSEPTLGKALRLLGTVLPVQYTSPSRADIATVRFQSSLEVRNEPRSNLIRVTTTAATPEEAARNANAVVAEYVHYRRAQMLALRKARAAALIGDLSIVYGKSHPNILRAKETLANTEAALEAHRKAPPATESDLAATGYVMPARPDSTPYGLTIKGFLLLALTVGLIVGIAYVLLVEFVLAKLAWSPRIPDVPKAWTARWPDWRQTLKRRRL